MGMGGAPPRIRDLRTTLSLLRVWTSVLQWCRLWFPVSPGVLMSPPTLLTAHQLVLLRDIWPMQVFIFLFEHGYMFLVFCFYILCINVLWLEWERGWKYELNLILTKTLFQMYTFDPWTTWGYRALIPCSQQSKYNVDSPKRSCPEGSMDTQIHRCLSPSI